MSTMNLVLQHKLQTIEQREQAIAENNYYQMAWITHKPIEAVGKFWFVTAMRYESPYCLHVQLETVKTESANHSYKSLVDSVTKAVKNDDSVIKGISDKEKEVAIKKAIKQAPFDAMTLLDEAYVLFGALTGLIKRHNYSEHFQKLIAEAMDWRSDFGRVKAAYNADEKEVEEHTLKTGEMDHHD